MKVLRKLVVVLLVLGLAGMAQAAKPDKANRANKANKPNKADKAGRLAGTIATVSNDGSSITVSSVGRKAAAQDVVVQINNATSVKIDGAAGKVSDLRAGMRVQVMASGGIATEINAGAGKGKAKDNPNRPKKDPANPNKKKKDQ